MTIPEYAQNPRPRPWWPDGDLSAMARRRFARRHESALRWSEWLNVRDEVNAELNGGADYPPDVVWIVGGREQEPQWSEERMAA